MATLDEAANHLRREADQLMSKADQAEDRTLANGYRQRAHELSTRAAELADIGNTIDKADAATRRPTGRTVPGMLTKAQGTPDLLKSAVKSAVHEAMRSYETDLEWIENELTRLRGKGALSTGPVARPRKPNVEARRRELLAKADECRALDPVASQGYRELARLLDEPKKG